MKFLALLFFSVFSFSASADQVSELLSSYQLSDLNQRCSVSYENKYFKIEGSDQRKSFALRIHQIQTENGLLKAIYGNYDGSGEIYFIKKEYSLLILATWTDHDNSVDRSSFCELGLK